jgi:glycosyltransferase involved in cell wall biosynthesis
MTAQMRVGFVTYGLDRPMQGIGRYTVELGAALERAGVDLVSLCTERGATGSDGLRLSGSRLLPGLLTIGQAEIAWLARRHGLDLVHDPTGCIPLGLTQAKRVATIHDAIPYVLPETCTKLDLLIYRCWLPVIAPRLDAIVTVSDRSRADICRYLPVQADRLVVVPCAAAPSFRVLDEARVGSALARYGIETPYILYAGSASARKNLKGLLEAYAHMRRWSSKWRLVAVGVGAGGSGHIQETVDRLRLGNSVHFAGHVPEQDLPALYNGADLFVFPSLYEGFGLPVLEAMACGTPVVTSDSSALPEVAGHAALLVDVTDPEEMALAMRRVLSETGLAEALRGRGLARSALFTWDRTARATVEVYERLLVSGDVRSQEKPREETA